MNRRPLYAPVEDQYDRLEPGFTLSGPIVRDRLWFFAGYIPSFRPLDRKVTFLADGTAGTYHQRRSRHQAALSLSAQLGSRWRARGAFSTGHERQDAELPPQDGSGNPDADYSIDYVYPNYSASANLDFTPGSRALLSLRAGYFFNNCRLLLRRRPAPAEGGPSVRPTRPRHPVGPDRQRDRPLLGPGL